MAVHSVGVGPFSPSHFQGRRAAGERNSSFSRLNRIFVVSSHSNPKILKPNRKSRHGRALSPYDSDDDGSFVDDDDEYGSDVSFRPFCELTPIFFGYVLVCVDEKV